ncbi:hypothetical protein PI124_g1431 [Phytophthora idaei]|nr:hypothetical protein PI125_g914 [Phytophthora idaei]KAG3173784.1 hypothetical protein PI126_g672 [Phytophthora idaei]KAG3254031.1 hypothetical protein PI124_g1431 [Phytophthora idaei]
MDGNIELPGGAHVPAAPGRYHVIPPPDLNEVTDKRFFLEYDFPFLIVREMSTRIASEREKCEAYRQVGEWEIKHPSAGGTYGLDCTGYQFYKPSTSPGHALRRQYIPDISYISRTTWTRLSDQDKDKGLLPCIPTIGVELMSAPDKLENLQRKVSKFVNRGTLEGVVVDTRGNRVWVYKRNKQPYFVALGTIEFEHWPGFKLDCIAVRDARVRAGLK